jgi:rod shape-determining protein MreD
MKIFLMVVGIILLAFLQIVVIPHFSIFGVVPNLVLAGLLAIFSGGNFLLGIILAVIGGLIYDLSGVYFGFNVLIFVCSFVIFWFLGKKYILDYRVLSLFLFGVLGTLVFNFLYVGFSYLLYHRNFFDYFLSWHNLLEALINGVVTLMLGFLFNRLYKFNK